MAFKALVHVQKARVEKEERRMAAGLPARESPEEKREKKPKSRALSIQCKCRDCQGGDADPGLSWRIGNCEIESCALWWVRPYQSQYGKKVPKVLELENE